VQLKLFSILLGLAIISISVPAAFADVFTVDDISCHEETVPPCDVTTPSADIQFMLDTLLIQSPGAGTSGIPPFPPGVPGVTREVISPFFGVPFFPPPPITVPPTPPTVLGSITFTALRDTGLFQYTFGLCPASAVAAFNPVTEKQLWAVACLGAAIVLFEDNGTMESFVGGDTTTISVCASGCDVIPGEIIHFFLIPNNDIAAVLVANPLPGDDFYPSSTDVGLFRAPLFMLDLANPGEFDQMLTFLQTGDDAITLFTWEDLTRDDLIPPNESDQDFTDLAFKSDVAFIPQCPNPPFPTVEKCLCEKFGMLEFCEPGGEFLEIESSALLLAGLQTSAVWILPIVLAGAGTGLGIAAFHLRRK